MEFDITRKSLFNNTALNYDRYRPGYPDSMIEDICVLAGLAHDSRLIEVGAGTGQATLPFAARNLSIDCVEPGDQLAELAASKCSAWPKIRIIVTEFEKLDFERGSYDLLFSAQAYHWIDPSKRMRLAADALRDGGSFALLYNYSPKPADPVINQISELICKVSGKPDTSVWDYSADINRWIYEINGCGFFEDLDIRNYNWEKKFTAEEYAGLFYTFSDFCILPELIQSNLHDTIIKMIDSNGGNVVKPYDSYLFFATKG